METVSEASSSETPSSSKEEEDEKGKNSYRLHRRKNIHNLLSEEDLDEETKRAKAAETERLFRLQELRVRAREERRNGDVNDVIIISSSDEDNEANANNANNNDDDDDDITVLAEEEPEDPSNSGSHVNDKYNVPNKDGKILVNVGHPSSDPDVFIVPQLQSIMKPHQIGGVRFLYDTIIESQSGYDTVGYGCILAHSMGLGKTIQIVSFTDIFLTHTPGKTVLIIVPINTIQNWVNEFNLWLPPFSENPFVSPRSFEIFVLNDTLKNLEGRGRVIASWFSRGGALIMGYELYRQLGNKKPRKRRGGEGAKRKNPFCIDLEEEEEEKSLLDEIQRALVNPGPDLVICDEGHRIKNISASISQTLKAIRTKRRIVLTGSPLQNNLMEYWCMVDFVRPNYLGSKAEFINMFERPIQNGQCADSQPKDWRLMKHRSHVLHNQLKGFIQRRSHNVLRQSLPPKEETVLLLRMTPFQRHLYRSFVEDLLSNKSVSNPLKAFAVACKIYNHPDVLFQFLCKKEKEDAMAHDLDLEFDECSNSNDKILGKKSKRTKKGSENFETDTFVAPNVKKEELNYDWALGMFEGYESLLLENSTKMTVFFALLQQTIQIGDKMLLFSQSLLSLSLIQSFLEKEDSGFWKNNSSYFRLDGSTSATERERLISQFNSDANVKLFLISTRAGSLGINLIGANRVVVFDASWNPCHDSQAVCRVYRYGQVKVSYIYRLVMDNSLEKKIYDRQINKQSMANRIVDELNPELKIQSKDLQNLVVLNENDPSEILDLSSVVYETDEVLTTVVQNYGALLTTKPFPHESLFIDRSDQRLSRAEKRLAERSYEMEKVAKNSSRSSFHLNNNNNFSASSLGFSHLKAPQRSLSLLKPLESLKEFFPFSSSSFGESSSSSPNSSSFESLFDKQCLNFSNLIVPRNMELHSSSSHEPTPLSLKAGESVVVISTPKGLLLRAHGRTIKIKGFSELRDPTSKTEIVTLSDDSDDSESSPIDHLTRLLSKEKG